MERPRWYDKSGEGERYSFRRCNWFEAVREECLAVRNAVGLMDLSSFAKFELKGNAAHAALSRPSPPIASRAATAGSCLPMC